MSEAAQDRVPDVRERIAALVREVLEGSSLYLVEVTVRGNRGSRVVEVYVDSDEALDVEDIARVSREIGFLLDTEDVLAGKYNLNVSSPGVERPLMLPRQYRKNVGRKLRIRQLDDDGTERVIEGELKDANDEGIVLAVDSSRAVHVAYDQVVEARVVLPW